MAVEKSWLAPSSRELGAHSSGGLTLSKGAREVVSLPPIPGHELRWRIGNGAYGEVWLARNIFGTGRALKLVHRRNFSDAYPFEREFKGIQKYEPVSRSHDGLIDILQIGRDDDAGCFYYIMELADDAGASALPEPSGCRYIPRTLREETRREGRLPAARCLEIMLQLTDALEHLHQSGLVHRDIKPSNIVFVGGAAKLADIGLVAEVDEARSFVGTMGFIPPEGPGRPEADVYGLGKVLYEMLTGKDRHEFPALPEAFLAKGGDQHPASCPAQRDLLMGLNQVVLRACEGNAGARYASARAMGDDLRLLHRGEPLRRRPLLRRLWERGKRVASGWTGSAAAQDVESAVAEANHLLEKGHLCALGATPERLRQSAKYFAEAVELDPQFVPAHIGLFRVRLLELTALPKPGADAVSNVRAAAASLMAVAPSTAEAAMASSLMQYLDGALERALAEVQAAARMPMCSKQTRAVTHHLAGALLLELGRSAEALEQMKRSEMAVPTCAIGQVGLGHPCYVQGRFDLALAQYQKSIELEPRQWLGHFWSGKAFEELGRYPEAIDAFELADLRTVENEASLNGSAPLGAMDAIRLSYAALRKAFENDGPAGYWERRLATALAASPHDARSIAAAYARLGRLDEAYAWLSQAAKAGQLGGLCFDLFWDRKDPRFQAIITAGQRPSAPAA